jgi:flagellar export protein FliJ
MAAKKEKYRLETMLQVRLRNKRNAEIELGRALKVLKEEEARLRDLEEEKKDIVRRREDSRRDHSLKVASGESRISESHSHMNFIKKLQEDEDKKDKEINQQQKVVKEAEQKVALKKRDYISACKEVKIMEKHKELWKKKQKMELEKEEAKVMNELGNVLHTLRAMREKQDRRL